MLDSRMILFFLNAFSSTSYPSRYDRFLPVVSPLLNGLTGRYALGWRFA